MKLSDIKGERAIDVIAEILDPIYNISSDKKCADLFKRQKLPEGMSTQQYGMEWLIKAARDILQGHKKDCIKILSVIEGTSVEEYTENLDMAKLLMDVADLFSDQSFMSLFFSQGSQSGETSSGSASGSTAVAKQ